jgi:hypothetical protein
MTRTGYLKSSTKVFTGKHLQNDDAECINVAAAADVVIKHLWGHVPASTNNTWPRSRHYTGCGDEIGKHGQ